MSAIQEKHSGSNASIAFERLGGIHGKLPGRLNPSTSDSVPSLSVVLARRSIGVSPSRVLGSDPDLQDSSLPSAPVSLGLTEEVPVIDDAHRFSASQDFSQPRRWRWARNVLLGASLSFADAGLAALSPMGFVWRNIQILAIAGIYMALPLLTSLMLLNYVPNLVDAFSPKTPLGLVYLLGLYVSSAFLLMLGSFSIGFLWRGGIRLMDHFAAKGARAFPGR